MIAKLERWAWVGGATLAGIAGMVNAVGFLSFDHQAVTHLTGPTTMLSLALINLDTEAMIRLFCVIFAFTAGAMTSGFIIRQSTLKLGRRYGGVLMLESILFFIAAALMEEKAHAGCYFASAACGLQNAMASTYSGTVLRTTHLTGMFNDLGASLGLSLRGIEVDRRRVKLSFLVIVSFFVGGVLGGLAFKALQYHTLYIPALLTGGVATAYTIYAHCQKKKINLATVTQTMSDTIHKIYPGSD